MKGYDRMQWGAYAELWFGYWLMSDQRINAFAISTGVAQTTAFVPSTMTLELNEARLLEGWVGLEAGWVFRIYRLKNAGTDAPAARKWGVLWAWLMRRRGVWSSPPGDGAGGHPPDQTAVLAHRGAPLMWFHVASLGELSKPSLSCRPIARPIRRRPGFSPSTRPQPGTRSEARRLARRRPLAVLPDDFPWTWRPG